MEKDSKKKKNTSKKHEKESSDSDYNGEEENYAHLKRNRSKALEERQIA
jgi:hypothetical protein